MKWLYFAAILAYLVFAAGYASETLATTAFTASVDSITIAILLFLLMLNDRSI